jgi:hypothetical protein
MNHSATQRILCALHNFLDSGEKEASISQNGHSKPDFREVHALSSGCARIESAIADDALPGLRRPHGL